MEKWARNSIPLYAKNTNKITQRIFYGKRHVKLSLEHIALSIGKILKRMEITNENKTRADLRYIHLNPVVLFKC